MSKILQKYLWKGKGTECVISSDPSFIKRHSVVLNGTLPSSNLVTKWFLKHAERVK